VPFALGAGERLLQHTAAVDAQHHLHGFIPLLLDPRLQAPGCPPGHHVDPEVHHQDDHEGQVKGEKGREQGIAWLLGDATDALIWWRWFLPPQQRPNGDDHGGEPDHHQDDPSLPLCHDGGILEGILDADIPVHGDDAQAHDGGGAAQHIHRCPDVAEDASKNPKTQHLQGGREGQHGGAEQQVGDGQVDDEVVGDCLQVPVASHRQDNKDVAHDGREDEDSQEDPDAHRLHVQGEWQRGAVAFGGLLALQPPGPVGTALAALSRPVLTQAAIAQLRESHRKKSPGSMEGDEKAMPRRSPPGMILAAPSTTRSAPHPQKLGQGLPPPSRDGGTE